MTPCNPRNPLLICPTCARHCPQLPHLAECRPHTVCIDATVIAKDGACQLHEPKAVAVQWWHEREMEAA